MVESLPKRGKNDSKTSPIAEMLRAPSTQSQPLKDVDIKPAVQKRGHNHPACRSCGRALDRSLPHAAAKGQTFALERAALEMTRFKGATSREPVRLGLIGAGIWGRAILHATKELPDARITAVASRNPLARRLVDDQCLVVDDWCRLIERRDVDGLILAVPSAVQPEIALHALAEGRPLLAARPLTTEVAAAERLYSEALRRQAVVMVDYLYLHHPAYEEMKRRLAELAPIIGVTATAGHWAPGRGDREVIWHWGAHEVAMALDLMGGRPMAIDAVRCESGTTPEGEGETIRLSLTFDSGARVTATCGNMMREATRRLAASTAGHTAVFDDFAPTRLVLMKRGPGGGAEAIPIADEPPLRRLLSAFVDAIRAGVCDLSSLALAVDVVRVLASAASRLGSRAGERRETRSRSSEETRLRYVG